MDLVPPHRSTLSPAAERRRRRPDTDAAVAAAAASAAAHDSRSRHRCVSHQHEAVQVRGHRYHDQFQEKSADQPLSIKIQNQTTDHHRNHQWPGLSFGFQRGVQVRAGHREQTQIQIHEHDGARTKT